MLSSWFRVGELDLVRVTWDSPASFLEKLMEYERVIEFKTWGELKQRLGHRRRLFAYTHPALPEAPSSPLPLHPLAAGKESLSRLCCTHCWHTYLGASRVCASRFDPGDRI